MGACSRPPCPRWQPLLPSVPSPLSTCMHARHAVLSALSLHVRPPPPLQRLGVTHHDLLHMDNTVQVGRPLS